MIICSNAVVTGGGKKQLHHCLLLFGGKRPTRVNLAKYGGNLILTVNDVMLCSALK